VRRASLPALLGHLRCLLDRGVRQFKFVDRTFNLNLNTARAILEFLFEHHRPGHFFHFEMIPDRLPDALREVIARFPPGALQFEIGVQTFNPEVAARIRRRQDYARLEDNFRFLRERTGVHLHADLIAGLPGESLESFAAGFDHLVALRPHEIQVGILKRLRGTPINRHDGEWQMLYNPHPPYEILQNRLIDFPAMQRLRRFARYWDLIANSGNFRDTTPLLWTDDKTGSVSPFAAFMRLTEWLYARTSRTDRIALLRLTQLLFEYLTTIGKLEPAPTAAVLCRDYQRVGRRDTPHFLRSLLPPDTSHPTPAPARPAVPKRQARHWA